MISHLAKKRCICNAISEMLYRYDAEEGDCDDEFSKHLGTKYTESETDQDSMLGSAVDALHRLCLKLGGKAVLPSIFVTVHV